MLDVVVVGLGAMGSAATYQLAKMGAAVVGIDQLDPPHAMGRVTATLGSLERSTTTGRRFRS